ncbi:large t-antigen [African green monkey polyomavirus]|uniref:Large T antigen n=5 Tax=African green monkey polyomavirus TaxID=12480 RepID=LT_POVLY|nr:large t-antigen [African green monkey polyomavirus]P04008.1 RecName: Full=Large T antigen; Short=LT; Short=LT-AG [B-lymphotropic polyomavirus]AAA47059.2 large t-antigen [African green monkey polyomavirus]AAA47065.1 large T antigen [Monkey B-lymphotropic papovavirus]
MDQTLSKEERNELMDLLQITRAAWGNLSMMKKAYKNVSKLYHPDKGGDSAKMQRLNELFQRVQVTLMEIRSQCGSSSSQGYFSEDFYFGPTTFQYSPMDRDAVREDLPNPGEGSWGKWWREFVNRQCCDDLFCSETMSSSSDEDTPPAAQPPPPPAPSPEEEDEIEFVEETPSSCDGSSSQSSYTCTPPKRKKTEEKKPDDFPVCLYSFLSHAIYSNKTMNSFLIYTTLEKARQLYKTVEKSKIVVDFKASFSYQDEEGEGCLLFLITLGKHRVSAVKHFCVSQCTFSFIHCKAVVKPLELYKTLSKPPFKLLEENKPGVSMFEFQEEKEQSVNWQEICNFANEANISDVLLLLGIYIDFAVEPGKCGKCEKKQHKFHYNYHKAHHANACLFLESRAQKNICQQAVDQVLAAKRLKLVECSRIELLEERFLQLFDEMDDFLHGEIEILRWMAGVAWYTILLDNSWDVFQNILQLITTSQPKKRNVLIKGPINSGKTTLASAFMHFFDGKALNINCPADKLSFELGCAIDQFCVLLDDVKGQITLNKHLQPGQGVNNLDNLRDHLDGTIKVNLEKKHVNKRSQIFPPVIMTMNEYLLPPTIGVRFALHLHLKPKAYLKQSLEKSDLVAKRILNSGYTILLLLLWYNPVDSFTPKVQEKVVQWKETLEKYVSITQFGNIQQNIIDGKDPLHGIVIEEQM